MNRLFFSNQSFLMMKHVPMLHFRPISLMQLVHSFLTNQSESSQKHVLHSFGESNIFAYHGRKLEITLKSGDVKRLPLKNNDRGIACFHEEPGPNILK